MSDTEPGASSEASHSPAPSSTTDDGDTEGLSPSVRRLARQFNIDVSQIRGSGPDGRLRPSDVMAVVSGRSGGFDSADLRAAEAEEAERATGFENTKDPGSGGARLGKTLGRDSDAVDSGDAAIIGAALVRREAADPRLGSELSAGEPTTVERSSAPVLSHGAVDAMTCIFECDMTQVLAHRRATQSHAAPRPSVTSYCVSAAGRALERLIRDAEAYPGPIEIGVIVDEGGREARATLSGPAGMSLDAIDAAIERTSAPAPERSAGRHFLTIHHHGVAGSIVALPSSLPSGQAASLGIGQVRRIVGIKTVDGEDTPRIMAQCLLSLSFDKSRIGLAEANRFMAECVRILEGWPPTPSAVQPDANRE